jgi:predicted RNA-binding Zn-ribbon protein involved in translation (DUF1610 family)
MGLKRIKSSQQYDSCKGISLSFDLGKTKISFKCPECGFSNSVTLNQVQQGQTVICSGCHKNIKLVDKDASTKRAVEGINKSIDDLDKTIDKFNRS